MQEEKLRHYDLGFLAGVALGLRSASKSSELLGSILARAATAVEASNTVDQAIAALREVLDK